MGWLVFNGDEPSMEFSSIDRLWKMALQNRIFAANESIRGTWEATFTIDIVIIIIILITIGIVIGVPLFAKRWQISLLDLTKITVWRLDGSRAVSIWSLNGSSEAMLSRRLLYFIAIGQFHIHILRFRTFMRSNTSNGLVKRDLGDLLTWPLKNIVNHTKKYKKNDYHIEAGTK